MVIVFSWVKPHGHSLAAVTVGIYAPFGSLYALIAAMVRDCEGFSRTFSFRSLFLSHLDSHMAFPRILDVVLSPRVSLRRRRQPPRGVHRPPVSHNGLSRAPDLPKTSTPHSFILSSRSFLVLSPILFYPFGLQHKGRQALLGELGQSATSRSLLRLLSEQFCLRQSRFKCSELCFFYLPHFLRISSLITVYLTSSVFSYQQ
ncbi:hypothetical protein GQ43DRAFT_17928 [Delitschia confertaspora ATCC 74209]|uniref:Transmembrane protein n=1 Tax=Delitschia confertaspora ATCC 74209 TaxID=1513339 RepID=A0A9P4MW80_9PLEO|nr:hypothetical protein GQ43DRAFT_17928 [Delitschia confertaspora ATCC 74209]